MSGYAKGPALANISPNFMPAEYYEARARVDRFDHANDGHAGKS